MQDKELTQSQKEDITKVLEETKPKKRGAIPSKPLPHPSVPQAAESQTVPLPEPRSLKPIAQPRKKFLLYGGIGILFLGALVALLFKLSPEPKALPKKEELILVVLPPESVSQPDSLKAKSLYSKAYEAYAKDTLRDYKDALQLLQEGLRAFPQDSLSLSLLAKSYLLLWNASAKDRKYLNAVRMLIDRAFKTSPSQEEALQAEALWYFRKNEILKASQLMESLIQKNSFNGETFLLQGEIDLAQDAHDKAIHSFEKALELDPSLARGHFLLGKAYQKKNEPEKAYEIYWIGLNLHPDHALSRLEVSLIDIQTFNALIKAETNLRLVTQFPSLLLTSDLAKAHYHLGWIYEEGKQLDFALKEYKKAFELEPHNDTYTSAFKKLSQDQSLAELPADLKISEESLHFLTIGNRYLDENRLVDALAQYHAALKADPKNFLAHFQMGQISEKQKKWKNALSEYEKALKIKGTHIESYVAIAKIHIRYFDFGKALAYIEKVKTIQPRSALIYALSGYYYAQKGDLEKAISEYKKSTELDPENFDSHFQLAHLLRLQKEYKTSEKYFLKSLKLKPSEVKIQTEVAELYFEQGLKSQAVDHLKKLSSADPLNSHYISGLGRLYYLGKDYSFAKEMYLKAIRLEENNMDALEGLALTYDALEQTKASLDIYKKLIKIDPSDARWYFERGKIQFKTGALEEALSEFKLTIQINENYPLAHTYAGKLLLLLDENNAQTAEEEFKKEIKINPYLKEPYMALANLLTQQGRFEEAQSQYQMTIRLDPSNADAYLNLGRIHQHLAHFETAIEFYKTALEKDPNRGEAYFQLGLIYKHLERKSDAIEAFENFMRVSPDASNIDQVKKFLQELKRF
ncbi:MAG: tetratricopeptide repeat protein [Deltaproteobacteria bacterium]|nr:tetratricopeptide repeat protein [Deltaproteobacteria bacterium]